MGGPKPVRGPKPARGHSFHKGVKPARFGFGLLESSLISVEILILAFALSMDAFAVTISNSCAYPHTTDRQRLAMPVVFGAFQGLMPLIGYYAVSLASGFVESYAGVIAFVILGIIGGRMVFGGTKAVLAARKPIVHATGLSDSEISRTAQVLEQETGVIEQRDASILSSEIPDESASSTSCLTHAVVPKALSIRMLLLQGIATSIDALLCGVSLLALGANIFVASPIIALVTFLCCLAALFIGRRVGVLLGDKAEIVGGVALILIGIKALI